MNIDQYRKGDVWVSPETGGEFDEPERFILEGLFQFCGCGSPEDALDYIHKTLRSISDLRGGDDLPKHAREAHWEKWKRDAHQLHGSHGAEYFIYYVFDQMELIEHGGSVPGWLTESGKLLLEDLDFLDQQPAEAQA